MQSLKDLIRNAGDIKAQDDVEIPEWAPGVKFRVTGLPSGDWEAYQNKLSKMTRASEKSGLEMTIRSHKVEIVAKGLRDQETDELVFPDLREGISILSKRSAGIINGLFRLIEHLSDGDRDFTQKVKAAESDFGDGPELRLQYDLAVAWRMTPAEVLDRFTEDEFIRVLAYQNLYGPAGPQRLDVLVARLGMDVAAPHMKKGKRPKLRDHLIEWSRKARPHRTGRELLSAVRGIQAGFEKNSARGRGT